MSEAPIDEANDAYHRIGGPSGPAELDPVSAPAAPRFGSPEDRDRACQALTRAGFWVVEIEGIGPSVRGRLGEVIDDAVERELRTRGAAGPGIIGAAMPFGPAERETAIGDQLYRARSGGARGIAVVFGPLRAAAGPSGALDPSDCAALRVLANAARERPVVLVLDARDARTGAYADPVPLVSIVGEGITHPDAGAQASRTAAPHALELGRRPTARSGDEHLAVVLTARTAVAPGGQAGDRAAGGHLGLLAPEPPRRPGEELPGGEPPVAPPIGAPNAGTQAPWREAAWRSWTLGLGGARGPQSLGALEKVFIDCYAPLNAAIAGGLDDPRAKSAHDEFRNTFVRSYTDAFATFAATSKRPRMILDVHDIAGRIARLHGARSTRLLLVDAMRWDLSRRISERSTAKLGSRAALTDELLLWSALPTTTARQLEMMARGIAALRDPAELEADIEPSRGRASEYVRRMRVGAREVCKLDMIEARIGAASERVAQVLLDVSEATAEVIARHAQTLAPSTLLFVFGDHGFTIDRNGSARQGGASPEEVLVGAFALLVGDVH